jgi:hypothetical protein
MTNAYRILVENFEGTISLGGPKHRWQVNIKMHHQDVGRESAGWIKPDHGMVQ